MLRTSLHASSDDDVVNDVIKITDNTSKEWIILSDTVILPLLHTCMAISDYKIFFIFFNGSDIGLVLLQPTYSLYFSKETLFT